MVKAYTLSERIRKNENHQLETENELKMVNESLKDLEMEIDLALLKGTNPPKYIIVHKILSSRVSDRLTKEEGYFLHIDSKGNTRIYYDKYDFDNRIDNNVCRFYPQNVNNINNTYNMTIDKPAMLDMVKMISNMRVINKVHN